MKTIVSRDVSSEKRVMKDMLPNLCMLDFEKLLFSYTQIERIASLPQVDPGCPEEKKTEPGTGSHFYCFSSISLTF
jgi:hypothetical protein